MMAIHLIRSSDAIPVSSDESESSVDQDDQSKTDEFLNAIEELVGRLDEASIPMARHEHPDTWAAVTKREESPVSSGGISRTAIGVHSRSALNKNFIRFGRSGGYQPRRALAIEKLRRYDSKFIHLLSLNTKNLLGRATFNYKAKGSIQLLSSISLIHFKHHASIKFTSTAISSAVGSSLSSGKQLYLRKSPLT